MKNLKLKINYSSSPKGIYKGLLALSLLLMLVHLTACHKEKKVHNELDLAGSWAFAIDKNDIGLTKQWYLTDLKGHITLPGTMDTNQKGPANTDTTETKFLSRNYTYKGKAWYQKTVKVPKSWMNQDIELFIERTKPSILWIDDQQIGSNASVSTPHRYNLTNYIADGKEHKLTLLIDSGKDVLPANIFNSHACSDHTQTCWNGLLGNLELRALPSTHIDKVALFPDVDKNQVSMAINFANDDKIDLAECNVIVSCKITSTNKTAGATQQFPVNFSSTDKTLHITYKIGKDIKEWNEFTPITYTCTLQLKKDGQLIDRCSKSFGMRNFRAEGLALTNNHKRVFLRGKHDGCVFPLTGYSPMQKAGWMTYLKTCKDYGLNHIRFHSWCPPEACMQAADELGMYLQVELPMWGTLSSDDDQLQAYLLKEGKRILTDYANHPSFVMLSLGNELKGDTSRLALLARKLKKQRPDLLITSGSNNFLGYKGTLSCDDYTTTCRLGGTRPEKDYSRQVRASFSFPDTHEGGFLNNTYPNTTMNFETALAYATMPVVGHETGQYQSFPNFDEIKKYTGILKATNMKVFEQRVKKAGLLPQAKEFFKASGTWQAALYRADIEMNLRSKDMSGFQLLDLQDYPGQGTALVGILDAFMQSKGFITPTEWRKFCAPVVPLVEMPKFVYQSGDAFSAKAMLFNYGPDDITDTPYTWTLTDPSNQEIATGQWALKAKQGTLSQIGTINLDLPMLTQAQKLTLSVGCGRIQGPNEYSLWVYPKYTAKKESIKTDSFQEFEEIGSQLYKALDSGKTVLLMPKADQLKKQTIKGLFMTDYWNYRMFRQIAISKNYDLSPGTLGLLVQKDHPALSGYPTDVHTDMQWYSILKNGRPLILDQLPHFTPPIVQVIDNVERNHKLGMLMEYRIGKGKLLLCMTDLKALKQYPEAQALYQSLVSYAKSKAFNPKAQYTIGELKKLFTLPIADKELEDLRNVSYTYKKNN